MFLAESGAVNLGGSDSEAAFVQPPADDVVISSMLLQTIGLLQPVTESINAFLARGIDAVIVGTAGDERADRGVLAQARFVRDL